MVKSKEREEFPPYRWVVLAAFMLVALLSQLLWLTFAPISSEASKIFGVSAFNISLLSLVWPLVFVIIAIPAGVFIDKKGFKKSVGLAAIIMAIFSILRVFSTYPSYNFPLLLFSQTGASISQAFIFGSITKIAVSWFPENEHGIANGLATIGLFLGMMLALIVTPMLYLSFGMRGMLLAYALLSCIFAVLFLSLAKENNLEREMKESSTFTMRDLWNLSRLKEFLILEFGFFAGVGGFTAIMTWLEEILHSLHGLSIDRAGMAGGAMIIGGIIGSIIIPAISDKTNRRKPFIIVNLLIGSIMLYVIGIIDGFVVITAVSFILGFFLMSTLPLVLEISSRIAGKGMEGRASSMLWFFSQVGSIVLIAAVEPAKSIMGGYQYSLLLIAALWIIALLLFAGLKEDVSYKT